MNPTKILADQTEAVLRLFFITTREEAAQLLAMYGPLRRMRETDFDAAVELRELVLSRFPTAEPPTVPYVDYFPEFTADELVEVAP